MGRRKGLVPLFIFFSSHRPPRAFFFSLPSLPKVKEVSAKENGLIQEEHTYSSISTIRLNSKLLGAGILRTKEEILRTCEGRKEEEASSPLCVFSSSGL